MTTNFITSCGKCGRDVESLGPPLIWSDQYGHICYGCHTAIPQGGQNKKIAVERKDILAVTRCEMMDPRHPDDPGPDRYCEQAAIGRTEDKVLVCEKCAVMMIRDGFTVHPLDYVFKEKEKICTRPCSGCGQPVTSSFDWCACCEERRGT